MEEGIKELRVIIDGLAQLTTGLNPTIKETFNEKGNVISGKIIRSTEIDEATDSLYLAKAWLGKVLEELGTKNPYGSGYKTKEDIESTQDVANSSTKRLPSRLDWDTKNHIEKVDWLRTEIQYIINFVKTDFDYDVVNSASDKPTREFSIARTNTYNYLCEAKFNLGFELGRIKTN